MELISIWREPEIVDKIEARTTKKKLVWEEVAVRLHHDVGFPARTGAQVYHKVKDLKRQFKVIHDKAGKSGAGKVDLVKFPYYHQLNDIMGKRHAIDPGAFIGVNTVFIPQQNNIIRPCAFFIVCMHHTHLAR